MVTLTAPSASPPVPLGPVPSPADRGPGRPSLRRLGPNWYAPVMGTAAVGTAGWGLAAAPGGAQLAGLGLPPVAATAVRTGATGVWALSALLLAVLLTARAVHRTRYPDQVRADLLDPAVAPFYGCLSMALLAVGAGATTAGRELLGPAALPVAAALFTAGTATGLVVAVAVPYLMVVRHRVAPGSATPVWLLPVVAPMVSAATGPLLVPHLPPGQAREALLLGCWAMFGLSLLATLLILPVVFARLLHHGPLPLALTPSLFLVLGPLGQSTTAVGKLADAAPGAIGEPYARGLAVLAVVHGVPVLGFALLWLALAVAMVVRAGRAGMPFTLGWWAFTFPVGTCVTGAQVLAERTGLTAYAWLAVALYAALLAAWAVAAALTARGLLRGELLREPRPAPPGR